MTGARLAAGVGGEVSAARLRAVVEELAGSRYEGRRVASAGGAMARAYLAGQLRELGAVRVEADEFEVPAGTAGNLHASLPRCGDGQVEVLLCAHYDGVGDLPGRRRPGASDNASGVAVVLEAARVLAAEMPAGLRMAVALLDAEEAGALGSARHAAELVRSGSRPLVVNVDGAGRIEGAVSVEAAGPAHGLLAALDQAGRAARVPLAPGQVASDNRRYGAAGLAAVGIGAGMPGYHTEHDTPAQVQDETLTAVTHLVIATIKNLAAAHAAAATNEKAEGEH